MKRPLLLAMFVLLLPTLALARPRVAVMKLENDTNGAVADLVSEILEEDATLVGTKEVNRTVDKLGLPEELTDRDVKKLASELEVDALVRGKINKKGDNHVVHFKVFVRGKRKGFSVEYSNLKSEKLKTALHDKFLEKISGTGSSRDSEEEDKDREKPADEEAAREEDRPKKRGDEEDRPKKRDDEDRTSKRDEEDRPKKRRDEEDADKRDDRRDRDASDDRAARDDRDRDDDRRRSDDDEDRPRRKKRTARRDDDDSDMELRGSTDDRPAKHARDMNRVAVRVDVGASMAQRTLQYSTRAFEQAPKPYKNSPVPGFRVAGEIYPFAFSNPNSPAAGFGIAGSYDKTISLSVQTTEQPGTKFPVTAQHFDIGARYRVPFGNKPTSPMVTLAAGFATQTFLISRAALVDGHVIDVPDTNYKGFEAGLDVRVPFTPSVALFAGGRAMFVTAAGPIQKNDSYGQAKITAGKATIGLDIGIGSRFAVRIAGEFAQFGYAFTGSGMMTNNRDGDPTTKDVGGAADRYLGGSGTFAVLY